MGGRVKTLHPKIHAGILSVRGNKKHRIDLLKNNFKEIDLVVVNFYPFKNNNFNKTIQNIDIGGPALVRAAAKNFNDVIVIANPKNYNQRKDGTPLGRLQVPNDLAQAFLFAASGNASMITGSMITVDGGAAL